MKRPRFAIAGLMAAVAAVAINLAVIRSRPNFFFACGVMPMASILVLLALVSAPKFVRGGWLSPSALGFQSFGWLAVFGFIACLCLAPSALLGYSRLFGPYLSLFFAPLMRGVSRSGANAFEFAACTVIFTLPELVIALFGGCLLASWKLRFGLKEAQCSQVTELIQ